MKNIGYYNGEIGAIEDIKIPMLDRTVFFGDSVYEMANFTHKKLFALRDHLTRFYNSCRYLGIEFTMGEEELAAEIQKVVDANELDEGSVYWQASRGTMPMRSFTWGDEKLKPNLIMFSSPEGIDPLDKVYMLKSHEDKRYGYCYIKTTNLLPAVLYSQGSIKEGCEESILHRGERVTECGHSNVIIFKDGILCAPPKDELILPGVTMSIALELAKKLGIEVRIAPFTMDDLRDADEVIITSTGVPCIRALTLDGKDIGGKDPESFKRLQDAFAELYHKETSRTELLDERHY